MYHDLPMWPAPACGGAIQCETIDWNFLERPDGWRSWTFVPGAVWLIPLKLLSFREVNPAGHNPELQNFNQLSSHSHNEERVPFQFSMEGVHSTIQQCSDGEVGKFRFQECQRRHFVWFFVRISSRWFISLFRIVERYCVVIEKQAMHILTWMPLTCSRALSVE